MFIDEVVRSFDAGLEQIENTFERWSRHGDLLDYVNVLEEWDEKVGDNWDEP